MAGLGAPELLIGCHSGVRTNPRQARTTTRQARLLSASLKEDLSYMRFECRDPPRALDS